MQATILHISDIHRTRDEAPDNAEILNHLLADLRRHIEEGIPRPDLVVVTGDITQSAEAHEYDEAYSFLKSLLEDLSLARDRIVVVPGNHDVHWPTCHQHARRVPPDSRLGRSAPITYDLGGNLAAYLTEEDFADRLSNFRSFYKRLIGVDYPTQREAAYSIQRFADFGLSIVGLSSVDLLDHQQRRASFNSEALREIAKELSAEEGIVLGAWHHDVDWDGTGGDGLERDALRELAAAGPYHMAICGHTHRTAHNNAEALGAYGLPVVAAGSLCAGPKQRPESLGRSYNILQIRETEARVWVRTKDTRGSRWTDLCRFGSPQERTSFFDVPLSGASASPTNSAALQMPIGVAEKPRAIEAEIKLASPSNTQLKLAMVQRSEWIRTRLAGVCAQYGIELGDAVHRENTDTYYDDPGGTLHKREMIVRVRTCGGSRKVTCKSALGEHAGALTRAETEFELDDELEQELSTGLFPSQLADVFREQRREAVFLERGFGPTLTVHNTRTTIPLRTDEGSYEFCYDRYYYESGEDFSEYFSEIEIEAKDASSISRGPIQRLVAALTLVTDYSQHSRSKYARGVEWMRGRHQYARAWLVALSVRDLADRSQTARQQSKPVTRRPSPKSRVIA